MSNLANQDIGGSGKVIEEFKPLQAFTGKLDDVVQQPSEIKATEKLDSLIFDSSETDIIFYNGFSQRIWDDNKKALVGDPGLGSFNVLNSILTIDRQNIQGRYIIQLLEYYPKLVTPSDSKIIFVGKNIYGPNPRNFQILFKCRALGGKHKITVVCKRYNTNEWILNFSFEIDNTAWVQQAGGFAVSGHENFNIEFHTFMLSSTPGILQITDMTIKEK